MKTKKKLFTIFAMAVCISVFSGCSVPQNSDKANEMRFSLQGITDVTISYDEEPIVFYQAEGDELVVKEYMTKNKSSYHARVKQSGDSINIREGGKPLIKSGFSRNIEVFLPASYSENLKITTTDGNIDLTETPLQLSELRIDTTKATVGINIVIARNVHLSTTSGKYNIGGIEADEILLDSTSGTITCNNLKGNVTYTSTSGNAEIKSAVGEGSYNTSNSGNLIVNYIEVTGDLYLYNKTGNINIEVPNELSFHFFATTNSGSVTTTFGQYLTIGEHTANGSIGENPTVWVRTETNSGNIEVKQKQ